MMGFAEEGGRSSRKMMIFVLKMMNFVFKMINVVFKMMEKREWLAEGECFHSANSGLISY